MLHRICDNLKLAAWKIKKKRERKADWNDKLKLKSKEKSETTTTHSHKTSLRIFSPFRDQKIWFVREEGKVSIGKDLLHFLRLLAGWLVVWTHGGKNEISPLSAHSRRWDVKIESVGKIPTRIKNYISTCSSRFLCSWARSPFAKKVKKSWTCTRENWQGIYSSLKLSKCVKILPSYIDYQLYRAEIEYQFFINSQVSDLIRWSSALMTWNCIGSNKSLCRHSGAMISQQIFPTTQWQDFAQHDTDLIWK